METKNGNDSAEVEARKWVQVVLAKENLQEISVDIAGNSGKGDGFIGDIMFVTATGTDKLGAKKTYNLVLKCSKASAALMETTNIGGAFVREIYVYEEIFPTFRKFQVERGIQEPFDSVPKYYGSYSDGFRYVIALENLKKVGYDLWPSDKPLTRNHIDLTIKEYAKFHAVSLAMKEQEPERFQKLIEELDDSAVLEFFEMCGFFTSVQKAVQQLAELLKSDLNRNAIEQWLNVANQGRHILFQMAPTSEDLQVILHRDCWSNNFLHKYEDDEKTIPAKVAILDWQISKYSSPVFDLSYFLFACLSEEDIADVESILRLYYNTLSDYVTKLGSNLPETHSVAKFLEEWKKFGKYGLLFCIVPIQGSYSTKNELPDMAESVETDFASTFRFEASNKSGWKQRMKPLVKYAAEAGLI